MDVLTLEDLADVEATLGVLPEAVGGDELARGSTAEVQAIIGMLDFGMSPQQAVSVPRFHADHRWGTVIVEPNFPYPHHYKKVVSMGNRMEVSEYTGRLSVIRINIEKGMVEGGADPRGGGGLGRST